MYASTANIGKLSLLRIKSKSFLYIFFSLLAHIRYFKNLIGSIALRFGIFVYIIIGKIIMTIICVSFN